jgi:uncharacterized protein with LGFP repeats
LYWTAKTGVREIGGSILAQYLAIGGVAQYGPPTTDETRTPDGVGRFNHLLGTPASQAASIYWTPNTGAHSIHGQIREKWASMGWERGIGYPTTDEWATPDGVGRYNHFSGNSSIYWTPSTGPHQIGGDIRQKWAQYGWERGIGYPTTDEWATPNGIGRYNHFTGNASIYWSIRTGAHLVKGEIRNRWAALGWEKGYLGLPTSDEYAISGGFRSDFQGGYIVYRNGRATDYRW